MLFTYIMNHYELYNYIILCEFSQFARLCNNNITTNEKNGENILDYYYYYLI